MTSHRVDDAIDALTNRSDCTVEVTTIHRGRRITIESTQFPPILNAFINNNRLDLKQVRSHDTIEIIVFERDDSLSPLPDEYTTLPNTADIDDILD